MSKKNTPASDDSLIENAELKKKLAEVEHQLNVQLEARVSEAEARIALAAEVEYLKTQLQGKAITVASRVERFEFNGKMYEVSGSARIPNLGIRTALEICVDEQAQAWLIEKGSGIIREVN